MLKSPTSPKSTSRLPPETSGIGVRITANPETGIANGSNLSSVSIQVPNIPDVPRSFRQHVLELRLILPWRFTKQTLVI